MNYSDKRRFKRHSQPTRIAGFLRSTYLSERLRLLVTDVSVLVTCVGKKKPLRRVAFFDYNF